MYINVGTFLCIYIKCIYIYTCIRIYIYTYIHIHTHRHNYTDTYITNIFFLYILQVPKDADSVRAVIGLRRI